MVTQSELVTTAGQVVISTFFWTAIFRLSSYLQPNRSYKWNARCVACIHGILISVLSLTFAIVFNRSAFTEQGRQSNVYEVLVLILCLGYFIFDTVWCLCCNVYGCETYIYTIHHAVSMMGMMTSLYLGVSGTEVNVTIFLAEVTNPFLQFRWFVRELGARRGDVLYELNDAVFIATYACMRLGLSPYLAYHEILHPRPDDIFKCFALVFSFMNVILSVGVLQFAYRKYTRLYVVWKQGDLKKVGKNKSRQINNNDTFALDHED